MNPAFRTASPSPLVRTPAQWAKRLATQWEWAVLRRVDKYFVEQTFRALTNWKGKEVQVEGVARVAGQRTKETDLNAAKQLYDKVAAQHQLPLNGVALIVTVYDYKMLIQQAIEESLAANSLGSILVQSRDGPQLIGPENIDSPLSKEELVKVCRKKGINGYSHQSKLELRKMLAAPDVLTNEELRQLCRLKGNPVSPQASRQELVSSCLGRGPDGMYLGEGACGCVQADFGQDYYKCSLTVPFGRDPREKVDVHKLLFLASLVDSSVIPDPTAENLQHACELVAAMQPSAKWLQKQGGYWQKMSGLDRQLLLDYTKYGDKIVNTFLRGERKKAVDMYIKGSMAAKKSQNHVVFGLFLVKLFTEDNLAVAGRTILKRRYKGDLQKMKLAMGSWFEPRYFSHTALELLLYHVSKAMDQVIRKAPKLDKDTVVFRGLSNMDHVETATVTRRDLISTSADYKVAWDFSYGKERTVMHILLPKGSRALAMLISHFSGESEVLLPPGTTLITQSCYFAAKNLYDVETGGCYKDSKVNHCYAVVRT